MSVTVICHSCGESVSPPANHTRKKMRCPICGVMLTVPESAEPSTEAPTKEKPTEPARDSLEEAAMEIWSSDDSPFAPPKESPAPKKKKRKPEAVEVEELEEIEDAPPEKQLTADQRRRQWTEDDENEDPYEMSEKIELCPSCRSDLPPNSLVCVQCGFDLKTKTKVKKTYEPLDLSWGMGWPLARRLKWLIISSSCALILAIAASYFAGNAFVGILPWILFTAMMMFLLGTFNRVELTRNAKGKCRLSNTWWICFFRQETKRVRLGDYDGVQALVIHETGCMEWAMFIFFLPLLVPAVLWFFLVIKRNWCQVAMTEGHGYPSYILYKGFSEQQMHEMEAAIKEVMGL